MAEAKQTSSEPKGTCAVKVEINVPVEEAWKLLGDWQKLEQCLQNNGEVRVEILEGENNTPNCVRTIKATRPDGLKTFANKRLRTLDEKHHTCTYQIEENNFGFSFLKVTLTTWTPVMALQSWTGAASVILPRGFQSIVVAVPLLNEMYAAIIKQAEKICLQHMALAATPASAPVAAAQEI